MLDRELEYKKMAKVESKLWWYNILHRLVTDKVKKTFKENKEIKILDAGCGTGGLLQSLQDVGYNDLYGFDFSEHAVKVCLERSLNVKEMNILDISSYATDGPFDVIICNDVLYFLSAEEQNKVMGDVSRLLKPGGIFISNVPALEAFKGTHDISVGIGKRFDRKMLKEMIKGTSLISQQMMFWPFFLSPLIFLVRFIQRVKMKKGEVQNIESDIDIPSPIVNKILLYITKVENFFLSSKPFGSSLFWVLKNKSNL